jgi:predicted helicase
MNSLKTIPFSNFIPFKDNYLFKKIDTSLLEDYNKGINPLELFQVNVMGFQTHRDDFAIDGNKDKLSKKLSEFANSILSDNEISQKYGINQTSDFNIKNAQKELLKVNIKNEIIKCSYRPFDEKYIYFDKIIVDRPRKELLQNTKNKENIILGIGRQGMAVGDIEWCLTTVSKHPVDANVFRRGGVNLFPLYLYPSTTGQLALGESAARVPNLNMDIVTEFCSRLQTNFVTDKEGWTYEEGFEVSPEDILDYIYAVLHTPSYREKYKEFLKIDFPRVPYPAPINLAREDRSEYFDRYLKQVDLGRTLREIHLMESPLLEELITEYPYDGDNVVTKTKTSPDLSKGEEYVTVWINETQGFTGVPLVAWNFYIGGYQPAQKWLKDRKDRVLDFEDILHYQKIIVALDLTANFMEQLEKIMNHE